MSVSYFEALEDQIPAVEAREMLAAAQAAVYPHAGKEAAERMWQGWVRDAYPPPPVATSGRRPLFTLNDRPVNFAELKAGLGKALGAGLSA
jgi:hypothetical protein